MTVRIRESEPIAIVGLGCRFPGGANSPERFWEMIVGGDVVICEVPPDRWDVRRFFDDDKGVAGKSIARSGGFLDGPIDRFDASFFGISPREAAPLDPQQRLLLEVTWEAVAEAGLVMDRLKGTRVGVFVGAFGVDNQLLQMSRGGRYLAGSYTIAGCSAAMLSNRISYTFGFTGPSLTIDTACSSSLVALHFAAQSLWNGESDTAIAGGVNLMFHPDFAIGLAKARFLSSDGRSKAFDASADGYGRGEGAGVVVLKRLSAALADGDPIRALIRGTGVNQDGQTPGITVPNGDAQSSLMREVCRKAAVSPGEIHYVEAHGTGTAVGDPIEARAIGEAIGVGHEPGRECYIGSVKANMGHLEAAAGIAGVIKAALCLEHRQIPPHPFVDGPNPHIPFAQLGLRLSERNVPWPAGPGPALAAVNSFGFGGTNAHIVLQEAPSREDIGQSVFSDDGRGQSHLLTVSASGEAALRALVQAHLDTTVDKARAGLFTIRDLCYSASVRSSHLSHRLALVVDSAESLEKQLIAVGTGASLAGMRSGLATPARAAGLVFVYTGMGPQWWAMGRELLREEPVFRSTIERIDRAFRTLAGWSLLDELAVTESDSRIHLTEVAQPMNFALQAGLTELWKSWGIEPAAVVGHSVGEVGAAYAAGVLDLEDAVRVSFHRSRLQGTMRGQGAMLAVGLSAEEARPYLESLGDRAVIAAINSPASCTFAGDPIALEQIANALASNQVFHRFLKVDIAYHSPQMEPLKAELLAALAGLRPRESRVPLYSTVTGSRSVGTGWDAHYWWNNVRQPVLFASALNEIIGAGHDAFLEIGPHPVLATSIIDCLRNRNRTGLVLASIHRQKPERPALLDTLGALYAEGYPIDWRRLYPGGGRHVRLPSYPWQRERHWCESIESREDRLGSGAHPLLDQPLRTPEPAWQVELGRALFPYLNDHRIEGTAVFPGAGYVEACLAAALEVDGRRDGPVVLEDVRLRKALILGVGQEVLLHVGFDPHERSVSIHSRVRGQDDPWEMHAHGRILERRETFEPIAVVGLDELRSRCSTPHGTAELYEKLRARGLGYGPLFQAIKGLWLGQGEVVAQLELPESLEPDLEKYHLHPVLLDASFQALLAAAGEQSEDRDGEGQSTFLPVEIGRIRYHSRFGSRVWCHGRVTECGPDVLIGDIRLFDESGNVLAEVRRFKCQALGGGRLAEPDRTADWLYELAWRPLASLVGPTGDKTERDSARFEGIPADDSHQDQDEAPLIFADAGGLGDALSVALVARGQRPVVVVSGSRRSQIDDRRFEIDPSRPDDMDWLLNQIHSDASPRHVVYLWGLDIDEPDRASELTDKQSGLADGVTLMHLIQALGRANRNALPRLWLVTQGAAQVDSGDSEIVPGQGALCGLARVIDVEHPELRCTVLDLDRVDLVERIWLVANELLGDGPESEVAFRGGNRHGLRIAPAGSAFDDLDRAARTVDGIVPYRLDVTRLGSFDNLTLRECPRREPGPGEVEVRVMASGLNYKDVLKVMGVLSDSVVQDTWSGRTLGLECAGIIERVGQGVPPERVGEEVQGWVVDGFRSHITASAEQFAVKFDGLTLEEAAAVPVVFLTAYYGLVEIARLKAGESVLIHAATGGVGLAAIQVARALGAEVFATAGSPEKRAYLRALGVEHVMDSRTLAFADEVLERTNGRGVDVVLNSLTGEALVKSVGVLAPYGRFIEIGKRDIDADQPLRLKPFNRNLMFAAIDLDRLLVDRPADVSRLQRELGELFRTGALGPLPVTVYPAEQAADAFRFLAQAKHIGKVVVSHGTQPISVAPMPRPPLSIRADGTYLITGGLGGFGLETARWLVDRGATSLVLVGRNGAHTPEAVEAVSALESLGAQVKVAAIDVTDANQIAGLFSEIAKTLPPVRGIFHAAMVLDDDLLDRLDAERFRTVIEPKARGAWNLHVQSLGLDLDLFVMYSSMVAVIGNLGQSSYAAANAFMDALAQHRRMRGLPALSINWGSLSEAGFVARNPGIARHLERTGLIGIPARRALDVLGRLLNLDRPQIGVARIDWSTWEQAVPTLAKRARFEEVLAPGALRAGDGDSGTPTTWVASLRAASPDERIGLATSCLREIFARVLRLPSSSIDLHHNINQLGIDSLMAVELQTLIASQTGASFSTMDFMAGPTLTSMAGKLLEKILPDEAAAMIYEMPNSNHLANGASPNGRHQTEAEEIGADDGDAGYQAITDVDHLSDIEVDELLARMMTQEAHH